MRIYALVEGKTESRFVNAVLGPHLALRGLYVSPLQVRSSREQKGGIASFVRVKRDLGAMMKQHRGLDIGFTTMFDLYALPTDFPGLDPSLRDSLQKARMIEAAMVEDLNDRRLIPYIQVHEFEALLFVDLSVLPQLFVDEDYERSVERLRMSVGAFGNPELINDRRETSPSHRLIQFLPEYEKRKAEIGPDAAAAIGLDRLRERCPHFGEWISRLEALVPFRP